MRSPPAEIGRFPEFCRWSCRIPNLSQEKSDAVRARMMRHAVRGPKGCILWAGNKHRDGYGRLNVRISGPGHMSFYTHRLSWMLANGVWIETWMQIDHTCDVPGCFNPEHLVKVRRQANARRSAENTNRKRALKRAAEEDAIPW